MSWSGPSSAARFRLFLQRPASIRGSRMVLTFLVSLASGPQSWFSSRVSRLRLFLQYWLVVLIWMALIFSGSSDQKSFQHSRIIEPFIRWLMPSLSDAQVDSVIFAIRKCAHFTEFAILALLLLRAVRRSGAPKTGSWSWRSAFTSFAVLVMYAISDEVHQAFVPTRQASALDVLIDSSGGLAALFIAWALTSCRNRLNGRQRSP